MNNRKLVKVFLLPALLKFHQLLKTIPMTSSSLSCPVIYKHLNDSYFNQTPMSLLYALAQWPRVH
uniref:Uncharacterized protein n=1 Tax=Rhizophora mucronata TaxID=61149 RepID=A0A2P2NI32_RHIMU